MNQRCANGDRWRHWAHRWFVAALVATGGCAAVTAKHLWSGSGALDQPTDRLLLSAATPGSPGREAAIETLRQRAVATVKVLRQAASESSRSGRIASQSIQTIREEINR